MNVLLAQATVLLALDPTERWEALRRTESVWGGLASPAVWIPLGVVVAAALVTVGLYRRRQLRRTLVAALAEAAADVDLTVAEQTMLARLAEVAEPHPLTDTHTLAEAFEDGVRRVLESRTTQALAPTDRRRVQRVIHSLRVKLGFGPGPAARDASTAREGTPQALARDTRVTVALPGEASAVDATVTASAGREVTIRLDDAPLTLRPGGAVMLRRVCRGVQWEYPAAVTAVEDQDAGVRLIGMPRPTNLRRFLRVPLDRPVFVARYGFLPEGRDEMLPVFVEGRLREIAGPGLRMEAPLAVEVGERVLVVLDLGDGKAVRADGVVRRVDRPPEAADPSAEAAEAGPAVLAVELDRLSDREEAWLVRQTQAAARAARSEAGAASKREAPSVSEVEGGPGSGREGGPAGDVGEAEVEGSADAPKTAAGRAKADSPAVPGREETDSPGAADGAESPTPPQAADVAGGSRAV